MPHSQDIISDSDQPDICDEFVASGLLSATDKSHVEELAAQTGEPLDRILSKLGLITERDFAASVARYYDRPFIETPAFPKTPLYPHDLNPAFLEQHRLIPLSDGDVTQVGVVDPSDVEALKGLSTALKQEVSSVVITASQWEAGFSRLYGELNAEAVEQDAIAVDVSHDAQRLKDLASEEPVVRLVNRIVADASRARASDIHFEPRERDALIKLRIDGVLRERDRISKRLLDAAVSRIKILANLDIAERRRPQDGRFAFPLEGRSIDIRASTVPTDFGESLVLRLLDREAVALDYDALGFDGASISAFRMLLAKPNGILLVTGPTGSGKTTTIYTFLKDLADGERKILTIEDPIEYRLPGVSQSQANAAIGLTFPAALRAFLRHDPDVMMVGEIRDLETARVAVQAALTGHLVLSTLHTNDAASAVTRLLDIGLEDFLVSSTLNGVIAQRLVRKLCQDCKVKAAVSPAASKAFEKYSAAVAEATVYEPAGCAACGGVGFKGRTSIAEIIIITDRIKSLITKGADASSIRIQARKSGFRSMFEIGLDRVADGVTTFDEVLRTTADYDDGGAL